MFTGLIKDIGIIKKINSITEGKEFIIEAPKLTSQIQVDDSIATNGVCLTAIADDNSSFKVQLIHTTLEKSNLGKLKEGSKVNLELALRANDRLGGHFVQGHINTVGTISNMESQGKNVDITIHYPASYRKYILKEGSIALDGISLTISDVIDSTGDFMVSIIPHTYENTTLCQKTIGDSVNIEVDMLAKYIENLNKYA